MSTVQPQHATYRWADPTSPTPAIGVVSGAIKSISKHTQMQILRSIDADSDDMRDLIHSVDTDCGRMQEGEAADAFMRRVAASTATYTTRYPVASYIAGEILLSSIASTQHSLGLNTYHDVHKYTQEHSRGIASDIERTNPVAIDSFFRIIDLATPADTAFDYPAASTLYGMYLWRNQDGVVVETPLDMYARVAIALASSATPTPSEMLLIYSKLRRGLISVATPILRNAGARDGQLASCFLQVPRADSIDGIFKSIHDVAMLSSGGGGIGIDLTPIRASGRRHDGVMCAGPMLPARILDVSIRSVSQGTRPGACAIYINIDHPNAIDIINARNPAATDGIRHAEIGVVLSNEFMARARNNLEWYFFCPHKCPELRNVTGAEYSRVYNELVAAKRYSKSMPAFDVFQTIARSLMMSGMPYVIFGDHVNDMSNQKNIGIVRSSNLCAEIVQVAKPDVITSCVLSAVNISKCIEFPHTDKAKLCVDELDDAVACLVRMLNRSYAISRHPVAGMDDKSRPIGIGVVGLADALAMLGVEFGTPLACKLSNMIARVMYCAAVQASAHIAVDQGESYEGFDGSPISNGILHCDMYDQLAGGCSGDIGVAGLTEIQNLMSGFGGYIGNVEVTRAIARNGVANSLFIAFMPTRTTSELMCVNDSFIPFHPLIHQRSAVAGARTAVSGTLLESLHTRGIYNHGIIDYIIDHHGSIQGCPGVPDDVQCLFKTTWEVPVRQQIDMAASRVPFVDQSQSLSYFMVDADQTKIMRALSYAHSKFLPTGIYYLHQRAAVDPIRVPPPRRAGAPYTEPADGESEGPSGKVCVIGDTGCTSCAL